MKILQVLKHKIRVYRLRKATDTLVDDMRAVSRLRVGYEERKALIRKARTRYNNKLKRIYR